MERKFNHTRMAYENSQNTIRQADIKATISITIQSLLVSVGLAGSLLMGTFEKATALVNNNALKNSYFAFFGIFALFSILGITASVLTYFPNVKPKEKPEKKRLGYLFFEHIKNFKTSNEYKEKLDKLNYEDWFEDLVKQSYAVSRLASTKMKYVKTSILMLLVNLISWIVLLTLSGVIGVIMTNGG